MSAQRFKNILLSAISLNKLNWAEKFTNEYIEKVQPEFRESMLFYSIALLHFEKKEFQKSLENLAKVKYEYFTLKMDVKSWMLKIYYELGYYEPAFSLMDSFKHFLLNNKSLSEHFKERNLNFLKCAGDLIKLKSGFNKSDIAEIENDLKIKSNIVHKDWLLQKIGQL